MIHKKKVIYLDGSAIIDVFYKRDEVLELAIFKGMKKEYKKLITFFGFTQPKKIAIKLVYTRKEMNEHWGESSTISAMVDNKNPYLIYIFSPLVFSKLTKHQTNYIIPIIIHEIAHTFITKLNNRCFAWMNEGLCEFLAEENIRSNIIESSNWSWFKDNDVLINPSISWREVMKHEGYRISHNLVSYIIKTKGKNTLFNLLKIRRIKDKNIGSKINKALGEDLPNVLLKFENKLVLNITNK